MAITSKILRIADNAAMTNARTVSESSTPNQFDVSELSPDTQYFVEVDVVNARGTSTSAQANFTTEEHIGMEPFNIRNIAQSAATVDWNTGSDNRNLQYSEDKSTWTNVPYANGKYSVTIPVGKKYYFQGSSTNFGGWWGSDEDVEVGGHILSLHYPTMEQPSNQAVSYTRLFSKNNNDTLDGKLHFNFSTLKIPVTRLNGLGAHAMFGGCTSITALNYDIFYTPDGNYSLGNDALNGMFQKCSSLTRIDGFNMRLFKNLTAWQEFQYMFNGCTSLEYVADDFFDTSLTPSTGFFRDLTCQYMFANCTSLTHPPVLPNVSCWGNRIFGYMFMNCTSLTDANKPALPLLNGGNLGRSGNYGYSTCFQGFFYGCTGITQMDDLSVFDMGASGNGYFREMYRGTGITSIDVSKMPTGTITQNCFYGMFRKTPITSIPSNLLPSTSIANECYREMFCECTSLTSVPSGLLPATTLANACYMDMFNACTNLTTVPSDLLPATTAAENCYRSMFYNCNKLTAAPSLPATTLASNCYRQMFDHCSSLTTAPASLPATVMATECYRQMFDTCTSLTAAPSMTVNSVSDYCCYAMFTACRNLSDVTGINLATTTMAKECYRAMFSNQCTALTTPLSLPATTLADGCYWGMYDGCTNLTGTVTLPARTLVTNCYQTMFNNCNKLQGIEVNFKEWTANCTQNWVNGITNSTGTFTCFEELPQTTGNSNIPTNWSVNVKYDLIAPTITHDDTDVILINTTYNNRGDIFYTTDGSTPTSSSTQYAQPFLGVIGQTIKAVVVYNGQYSTVSTWVVAAEQLPEPTVSGLPTEVTITNNDTSGASVIYYTTDGTTPTSSSTVYSQPFTVTEGDTVKAVCANATGGHLWLDSDVVSEEIWNRTVISYIYAQTMGNVGDAYSELDKLICTNVTLDNTLKARWWGLGSNYQTACLIGNNGGGNQSYRQRLTMQGGGGWTQAHWINWGVGAYVAFPNNEPLDLTMGNLYIYNNLTSSYLDGGENNAPSPNTGYCYVDIVSRKCAGAQVWKKVNGVETLLFDGVAAVSNGVYGLWDNISHQLFTNTNITVTGE